MRASEEDLWRAYFAKTLFVDTRQDWILARTLYMLALINSGPPVEYDDDGKILPPPDDWKFPYTITDFLSFDRPGMKIGYRPEIEEQETAVTEQQPTEEPVPRVQRGRERPAAQRGSPPRLADPTHQQDILKQLDRAFGRG